MEVADTEAVTLVGATSAAVTLPGVTSADAVPMCTLAAPMCTLAGPASPEAATSGVAAAALLAIGVEGIGVMDPMAPATRTAGLIRTATGRNELKPMGVLLNVHLASHESSRLVSPADDGGAICVALRDHQERRRKRSSPRPSDCI